jgi:hypothetical protein
MLKPASVTFHFLHSWMLSLMYHEQNDRMPHMVQFLSILVQKRCPIFSNSQEPPESFAPGPPTGRCPGPAGDPSRWSAAPSVKSWIRAWFGPYAYGPDQIRMLIYSDHTRMVWPPNLIWNVTVSILLINIPYCMIISTHCSNDPSYELGLNKLELYSVLGIVNCRFSKCLGKTNVIHTYIK